MRPDIIRRKRRRFTSGSGEIKAKRGEIIDRNGPVLATNRTVCTISVIHSQGDGSGGKVIQTLSGELGLPEEEVREKVEKVSSRERIQANVDKKVGGPDPEYGA